MPVEKAIPPELTPHVADPIQQDIGFEPFIFDVGTPQNNESDFMEPFPFPELEEQEPAQEKRKLIIKDLPPQKPVSIDTDQPELPFQGDSVRFDHPKRNITIVAFGADAARLSKKHPPLSSSKE